MITESDLRETLTELADAAPEQCDAFRMPTSAAPATRSRHALAAVGGALVAAAVVAGLAIGAQAGHGGHTHRSPAGHPSPSSTAPISSQTRARLIAIARADASANDDRGAAADAVLTTYQRLGRDNRGFYAVLAALSTTRTRPATAPTGPVWVVQLRGTFDNGNTVITTFVDGTTLHELAGTAGVVAPRAAQRQLAALGAVVHLF